jgi:hypothetical protein
MTTAPKTFHRQVAAKKAAAPRPTVEFMIESMDPVEEGEEPRADQFHATLPSDERLFILAAMAGDEESNGTAEAAATLDLLRSSLPDDEFRLLKRRLLDSEDIVDMELLQDILMWLTEEWSTFPTVQSSASSESPPSTGARSTGRVRGQGSTRSTSR